MKFLPLWFHFCMTREQKAGPFQQLMGFVWRTTSQSTVWQSLYRHSCDCALGILTPYLGRSGKTQFTSLIFNFPGRFKTVSHFLCVRECLLSCRVQGPNPEVKLSLNCHNQLICVSKPSVPAFALFSEWVTGTQIFQQRVTWFGGYDGMWNQIGFM